MADIICVECKANVSDESGYCPECGFPFDSQSVQNDDVVGEGNTAQPNTVVTTPLDIILQSLNSVGLEMKELQDRVDGTRQDLNSQSMSAADSTQKMLTEISAKLDAISSVQNSMKAAQSAEPKKTKKQLLSAFYKTLNSPNSMFEYMFYICIVQIVFVIATLFLAAYVVTLVR